MPNYCYGIYCSLFLIVASCSNRTELLTPQESAGIKESVQQMVESIAVDISREGPIAWLRYFDNNPEFFMAYDGLVVFQNNDSARIIIKNSVVKQINKIELRWSNLRIDPLTLKFANVAVNWHEDIIYSSGKKMSYDGYFTGIADKTAKGWQFRNAHWSSTRSN